MSNLRPTILDDYGLEAALQNYLNEFQSRYDLKIRFEKPNPPLPRLGTSIEMTLLRIAQETLTNVARHAHADQVAVFLQFDEKTICLTVQDNGIGIESGYEANHPGSHGLKIMRERAEAVEGNLKVASIPGQGTKIEAIIPLPNSWQNEFSQEKYL